MYGGEHTSMKIIIGAGDTKIDGYVTVDYFSDCNPDYCLDVEKDVLPFDDNSVETVVAHHVLEHLGAGYFHCLQELYRVCKSGAIIDVRVPHPRHDSYLADPTHQRPITPLGLTLFSKKFNQQCRESQSPSSRLGDFFNVDFEIISWDYIPDDLYREAFAGKSADEVENYINEHNNIVQEIHIRLVVIK